MKSAFLCLAAGLVLLPAEAAAQAQANATLLSRFDPSGTSYNDIWGYVTPDGREYALLGTTTGTYVLDCSDPTNPINRGFFSGPNSSWRDIRTYREYAYIVTEGGGGVQILDLNDPDNPVLVKTWGQSNFSNAHNIAIDTEAGVMYPCGTNNGVLFVDIATDPINPILLGSYTSAYVHDLHVQDGMAHLAEISSSRYRVLDVSNLPNESITGSAFWISCHNAWPTRDNQYVVTTSETFGGGVGVFNIQDPSNPQQIASFFTGGSGTSAHNAFVRDRVIHVGYYSEGYQTLDISDPNNPKLQGFYDTSASTSGFSGAWGCYPFQPSGVIYISDRSNGLHILESKTTTALYGDGKPGGNGKVPSIHTFGAPFIGNSDFALEVEDAAPNTTVTLLLGIQGSLTVKDLDIHVALGPGVTVLNATTDSNGYAKVALPIPQGFPKVTLSAQFLVSEAIGQIGLTGSRGLSFELYGTDT